jgi:hypothetical protein
MRGSHGQTAPGGMEQPPQRAISASRHSRHDMNSWYLPALPAAAALSFIAYSFLVGF